MIRQQQHTISVLVQNKFGALAKIASLFSLRGYNIDSLTVNKTENPEQSRMTIVTFGDTGVIEQIEKQLLKLEDVVGVTDLNSDLFIERELCLIKVKAEPEKRPEIVSLVEIFGGTIVNVQADEIGIEVSGITQKIENFIELIAVYGIIEIARTGCTAISAQRGSTGKLMKTE